MALQEFSAGLKLAVAVALIAAAIFFIGIKTPLGQQKILPQVLSDANFQIAAVGGPAFQKTGVDKSSFQKAPELSGIAGYINTDPSISIEKLKGKVILIDFWTYTCINCIRTFPHLKELHEKYAGKGLVIIGVHTPEFDFEKDYKNVKAAVEKYGIKYPVVQDNDYATWNAYSNRYWPHEFLIDSEGYIRYDHIGEGGYEETEQQIVALLKEKDASVKKEELPQDSNATNTDFSKIGTPELYLGYAFARAPLGNSEGLKPEETVSYSLPNEISPNLVYLEGDWENKPDFVRLVSDKGKVALVFQAKNVNIVAGSPQGSKLKILIDNKPITKTDAGADAVDSNEGFIADVNAERLYNLVSLPDYGQKILTFEVEGKGLELYTFTFG